jgi:hypothetical protein
MWYTNAVVRSRVSLAALPATSQPLGSAKKPRKFNHCHTSAIYACNPFVCHTYKTKDFKPLICHTFLKFIPVPTMAGNRVSL